MGIYEKLLQVQVSLKAPKSQFNSFGGYKYRNCEDILEVVKPLLAQVGALILLTDEVQMVGTRYYVKATAKFIDIESCEFVEVCANAREEETKKGMDGSQITGASSSYARKYALNGLLDIDDTKDIDTTNKHGKDTAKSKLENEFIDLGGNIEKLKQHLGVEELTAEDIKDAIKQKKDWLSKKEKKDVEV